MDLQRRWRDHRKRLSRGSHHSAKLQAAWNKYGEEAFTFEVLEHVADLPLLTSREQEWMDRLGAVGERGYNLSPRAGSSLGVKHSEETRKRVGAASRGRKKPEEARRAVALSNATRVISDATRAKIAERGRGRKISDESREKMRQAALGRQFSPETRAKISAARRRQTQDHKEAAP